MAIAANVSRWISAGLIAGSLVSCNPWTVLSQQEGGQQPFARQQTIPVIDIAALSSANLGANIYVKGKVTQSAPFLTSGGYEIQDPTGRIWVITQRSLPKIGEEVVIAGQLNFHDLQVQQSNFGELFIQETQTLDPAQVQVNSVAPPAQIAPPAQFIQPETPKKERLDLQFLPHKEQRK